MHRKLSDAELESMDAPAPTPQASRQLRCAKCGQTYAPVNPKTLPFCSIRCQQLDLAGWLDEEYGLPFEGDKSGQQVEYVEDEPGQ